MPLRRQSRPQLLLSQHLLSPKLTPPPCILITTLLMRRLRRNLWHHNSTAILIYRYKRQVGT